MEFPEPEASVCSDCTRPFRNSPGNWHCESKQDGICNTCYYAIQDKLRKPYGHTKIGF